MKVHRIKTLSVAMIMFFVAAITAATALAEDVDSRIRELQGKLAELKGQQLELTKEATAAAAAMPSFSYRPGNGFLIEAADKSWSFSHTVEAYMRYNFVSGRDQVGRSHGELEGRRLRPEFRLCVNNCLWEIDWRLDLDGFGNNSSLQRGVIYFHAENLNPWLPTVQFGMDTTNAGAGSRSRQGSSSTGAQAEYDLHTANNGFNTGSGSSGITLTWDDRSLTSIGIPGRISRFEVGMNAYGEGGEGTQLNTDRKDFATYLSIEPFSELKNKWLRGFLFEYGAWFCNADNRSVENGCTRYRIRDNSRGGRQTLFDSGTNTIGDGLHVGHGPGILWNVGPYTLRAMGYFQRSEDRGGGIGGANGAGKKRSSSFLIGHDLYLWSPKGWLTGSSSTTGSILVGTHFERVDMSCGDHIAGGATGRNCAGGHMAQFHRNRVLLREWDLWYFVAPRMSVGVNVLWYDAANLRNGRNNAAHNLGICDSPVNAATCRSGIGGDWVDAFLNWRYQF